MESLANVPGVSQAEPFYLSDDTKHQPLRCSLLVHPGQGWAIATEIEGGPGLAQSHVTLATKVCQQYGIAPEALALFTRYAHGDQNMYAVHFDVGEPDLFEGVRFLGAHREQLHLLDVAALVEALASGQAPAPAWRAVVPTSTISRSRS